MRVLKRFPRVVLHAVALLGLLVSVPSMAQDVDLVSSRPPGDGPTEISVSFYLIDLMRVIDVDETFEADVFLVGSWKDSRLAGDRVRVLPMDSVWMPRLIAFNRRDIEHTLPEEVTVQPDGTVIYRQRIMGTFASPLDLKRFPLDTQSLEVKFVIYGSSTDEVVLVPNPELTAERNPNLAIRDWTVADLEQEQGVFDAAPGAPRLSMLSFRVDVRRVASYYVVQMLIPLLLIVCMSWIVFWIDPNIIPTRMSVSVTTVLTLIAYRFMVNALMPKLPYLTLVDHILLGATLLVAVSLVLMTIGTYRVNHDQAEAVKRTDRVARIVLPLAFVVMLVGLARFS